MLKILINSLSFIFIVGSSIAQSPVIGGYNVYYGFFHNHSTVSDGTGTDDQAYNYAKNTAKLDFFATANHMGSIVEAEWVAIRAAADKYNEDGVFTAFWGFEWSGNGHITVTHTEDYPGISEDPANSFAELCAWLEARNGVAIFNHPGRGEGKVFGGFAAPPCDKIVGMELWNGTADFSMHYYNDGYWPDDGNLNHYGEANSRGWRIGAAGSDDNHAGTWGTRSDYRMAILADSLTRPDILAALKARRFFTTLDKNIALSFKMDTVEMGSFVEGGDCDVHIRAMDSDGESFTKVMLFRDGYEMNTWEMDTAEVDIVLPFTVFDNEFYYVKVTQADGNEAISSPIYVKGGLFNMRPTCTVSSPMNGNHFEAPQTVTITAEASDVDGSVASVEFFADGISIGVDSVAPYSIDFVVSENGSYEITVKVTDDIGTWDTSDPVAFTVGVFSKTVSSRIADGNDDVEENSSGGMYTNSSDIELVFDGSNQTIGLRFTGLNIPPGAAIGSAYIQFTVDEASAGPCFLSIKGHDDDDSPSFSTVTRNVSGRLTTSAEVTWEPADWPVVGAAGPDQRTIDLRSIIQEIVNRPGYTQSSAITMIITGTGERTAEAYEGSSGSAALLSVDYTFGLEPSGTARGVDENRVRIFPNPVIDGKATVRIDGEITGNASVSIIDIMGRTCYRAQIRGHETAVDVNGIRPGIYFVNILNGNRTCSYKFLIE